MNVATPILFIQLASLILITMPKKTVLIATVLLALAGVIAVKQMRKDEFGSDSPQARDGIPPSRPVKSSTAGMEREFTGRISKRVEPEYPDLIAEYGESRTKLSKQVLGQVIGLLEEFVKSGEIASSRPGGNRENTERQLGSVVRHLVLNEQQKEQVTALYGNYLNRQLQRSRSTISRLKKDPTALMKLMLVGDSLARGEITKDEYTELQAVVGEDLAGIRNPLTSSNFDGSWPLKDDVFRQEMTKILDETQTEKLASLLAKQDARRSAHVDTSSISQLPAMDLSRLDAVVTSNREIASGLNEWTEGLRGLFIKEDEKRPNGRGGE